jgi:ornithine carbamoyltransferase
MSTVMNLRGRDLMTLAEYSPEEITYLLDLAAELKAAKREGTEEQRLVGKEVALIFEKDSTRTRCAFEVAAYDQGAHVTFIGPSGSHMGHKETVKDTARVLGRMYDAIEYRGFGQETAEELAQWSGVPVYNGLTDEWHPTQILADFLTFREHVRKPLDEVAWRTRTWSGGRSSGWTSVSRARRRSGRATRLSSWRARSQKRPAGGSRSRRTFPRPSGAATCSSRTCGCPWASRRRPGRSASSS